MEPWGYVMKFRNYGFWIKNNGIGPELKKTYFWTIDPCGFILEFNIFQSNVV